MPLKSLKQNRIEKVKTYPLAPMHAETRNEADVAIEETVLRDDPTYTRPASIEHPHNEQFYVCFKSVTISYENTVTVDLSKESAFLQTAAREVMVIIET